MADTAQTSLTWEDAQNLLTHDASPRQQDKAYHTVITLVAEGALTTQQEESATHMFGVAAFTQNLRPRVLDRFQNETPAFYARVRALIGEGPFGPKLIRDFLEPEE